MKLNIQNPKGYNLVEIVLAMAVSAIVLGGVITTINIVSSGNAQYNILQGRNEIINKIRIQAVNLRNLVISSELTAKLGNAGLPSDYGPPSSILFPELLMKCLPEVANTSSFGCDKRTIEEPGKGFLFYLSTNGDVDPDKATAGEDVYYRGNGMRCAQSESANSSTCPLQARVWFEPFCLNYADVCTKAMTIAVRYAVGLREDLKSELNIPTSFGEFYIPLQKGIQLKSLLTQNDLPLAPNSKGIYTIEKFYGHTWQNVRGVRLEAQVANPSGLVAMKIQYRYLTGTAAKGFSDVNIPDTLIQKSWEDLLTPGDEGSGPWSITLNGASPNQTFNFGTQINSVSNSRSSPTYFKIGSDNSPKDANYRWTVDEKGNYKAPTFKSGFYQFRVLANDSLGGTIESSNYITIRLISLPEFEFYNANFNLDRNCVDMEEKYSIYIADDEALTQNKLTLNNQILSTSSINGTDGIINFSFQKNQPAGSYPIVLTLKNRFSGIPLDNQMISPTITETQIIQLTDVPVTINNLASSPLTFRVNSSGNVKASLTSGSCCNSVPSVNWSYPCHPSFVNGDPNLNLGCPANWYRLLSGPSSSLMSCTVNGNSRTCETSITANTGNGSSPPMTSPPTSNIYATLVTNSSDAACMPNSSNVSPPFHLPIVNLPKISFYLKESLWLDIPPGPPSPNVSIAPIEPKVYVRIDYPPDETVSVDVVNSSNVNEVFCTLTFEKGTGSSPIDKSCSINRSDFSGTIWLVKNSISNNTIKLQGENSLSSHYAKLEGNLSHTFCRAKIASLPDQPLSYTVPTEHPMLNSPYGFSIVNGQTIQDSKNDTNQWPAGRSKTLRCYDHWGASQWGAVDHSAFRYPYEKQDFYEVYKLNEGKSFYDRKNNVVDLYFSDFNFPSYSDGKVDATSKNVPYLYLVMQNGPAPTGKWSYRNTLSGSSAQTVSESFENITPQLCSGNATLQNIQLLRMRASIKTDPSVVMKTVSGFYAMMDNTNGVFSYLFMCHYGRWNPAGKSYNSWID